MKTNAIIYLLISIFCSVECISRRYSVREEEILYGQNISLIQDNGTIRTDYLNIQSIKMNPSQKMSLASLNDVTLMLFTRKTVENEKSFKPNEAAKLNESNLFDPKKPNFFIIHGWTGSYKSKICVSIKNAILNQTDVNVFVVDWKRPAGWTYGLARSAVSRIGELVAEFINDMVKNFSIPTSSFQIAGHSLGAHIAGCVGKKFNGQIDCIIGMDPARPLFKLSHTDRLNISDANFVQVIHTNAFLLGFDSSLGHVDIFPNNGYRQPGCTIDLTQTCSHGRSYEFYAESILSGGFNTKQCEDYNNYKDGKCNNNQGSYLGGLNIDKTASGDHYLNTNSKSPFSIQIPRV